MQLVALMAATQEGPVGVEAALLTRSPHVTFIHVWDARINRRGVKAREQPRASISPVHLGWSARELPTPPHPAQPHPHRSGCWAPAGSPARTGSERSRAGSHSGAGSSGSGTRLYLAWRREKEGRSQEGPNPAGTQGFTTHSLVRVWGLGWASSARSHTCTHTVCMTEVAGDRGEAWGAGESQARDTEQGLERPLLDSPTHSGPILR